VIRKLYYGPPEWLVQKWNAQDRRAFAFWSFWVSVVLAIFFGGMVWFVTALSLLALVANFTAETPVEHEEEGGDTR